MSNLKTAVLWLVSPPLVSPPLMPPGQNVPLVQYRQLNIRLKSIFQMIRISYE